MNPILVGSRSWRLDTGCESKNIGLSEFSDKKKCVYLVEGFNWINLEHSIKCNWFSKVISCKLVTENDCRFWNHTAFNIDVSKSIFLCC